MNRRNLIIAIVGTVLIVVLIVGGIVWLRTRSVDEVPLPGTPSTETNTPATTSSQELAEALENLPPDADGDGLSDEAEAAAGTNPQNRDSDADGRSDFEELSVFNTDPLQPTPDQRDTSAIPGPISTGTPQEPPSEETPPPDSDGDGLTDDQERQLGTNPNAIDSDGDGLSDSAESAFYRTSPTSTDTDRDGFKDADEIKNGYNPRGPGRCEKPDCSA